MAWAPRIAKGTLELIASISAVHISGVIYSTDLEEQVIIDPRIGDLLDQSGSLVTEKSLYLQNSEKIFSNDIRKILKVSCHVSDFIVDDEDIEEFANSMLHENEPMLLSEAIDAILIENVTVDEKFKARIHSSNLFMPTVSQDGPLATSIWDCIVNRQLNIHKIARLFEESENSVWRQLEVLIDGSNSPSQAVQIYLQSSFVQFSAYFSMSFLIKRLIPTSLDTIRQASVISKLNPLAFIFLVLIGAPGLLEYLRAKVINGVSQVTLLAREKKKTFSIGDPVRPISIVAEKLNHKYQYTLDDFEQVLVSDSTRVVTPPAVWPGATAKDPFHPNRLFLDIFARPVLEELYFRFSLFNNLISHGCGFIPSVLLTSLSYAMCKDVLRGDFNSIRFRLEDGFESFGVNVVDGIILQATKLWTGWTIFPVLMRSISNARSIIDELESRGDLLLEDFAMSSMFTTYCAALRALVYDVHTRQGQALSLAIESKLPDWSNAVMNSFGPSQNADKVLSVAHIMSFLTALEGALTAADGRHVEKLNAAERWKREEQNLMDNSVLIGRQGDTATSFSTSSAAEGAGPRPGSEAQQYPHHSVQHWASWLVMDGDLPNKLVRRHNFDPAQATRKADFRLLSEIVNRQFIQYRYSNGMTMSQVEELIRNRLRSKGKEYCELLDLGAFEEKLFRWSNATEVELLDLIQSYYNHNNEIYTQQAKLYRNIHARQFIRDLALRKLTEEDKKAFYNKTVAHFRVIGSRESISFLSSCGITHPHLQAIIAQNQDRYPSTLALNNEWLTYWAKLEPNFLTSVLPWNKRR